MLNYSLERIKRILEEKFGDIGLQMFETSLENLKIGNNSPPDIVQKLTYDLEEKLMGLYGADRAREFLDDLNNEIAQEETTLKSQLKTLVDDFFMNRGIPGESDINDQAKNLVSKGLKGDEGKVNEILKQLSKDKIISALNDSIINSEIKSFLDRYQSYTQADLEDFINYLKKISKLNVNDSAVKDMVEIERLYRKFNDLGGQEEPWPIKICKQYSVLLNSSKKNDFKYLLLNEEDNRLLKKIAT